MDPIGYMPNTSADLQLERRLENQFNIKGGYSTFTVSAKGRGSANFTWNDPSGNEIPEENNPYLVISPITEASFGMYRVTVENSNGESIASEAQLCNEKRRIQHQYELVERVDPHHDLPSFSIVCQPTSVEVVLGKRAELSVVVAGCAVKFQWYEKSDMKSFGRRIQGQTRSKLVIEEVEPFNCIWFYVEVRDIFGQRLQSVNVEIRGINK